jgi:hypothetical protein
MTADVVQRYTEAREALLRQDVRVRSIVARIQHAAAALEHWRSVHVANAGVGFPKDVMMMNRAIDAKQWPTAMELADALAAWHAAAEEAWAVWSRVPPTDRARLEPPPEGA